MTKPNLLHRRDVVKALLANRKEAIAIGGLGASTNDITAAGDHARNFYLWGGMGGAAIMGLGLAQAQPKLPVVVITGDGEMLMGIGALAVVADQRPANLAILVLDNESFAETGGQRGLTANRADIALAARGFGFTQTMTVSEQGAVPELAQLLFDRPGPREGRRRHRLPLPARARDRRGLK